MVGAYMNFTGKTIGIWGLGVVGKSAIRYAQSYNAHIEIMDAKTPTPEDTIFLAANAIPFYPQDDIDAFLTRNTYIIPSPGIDLRPYAAYRHKFIGELDLFATEFKQPIIAVTGSIGKTSITTLLSQIITRAGLNLATGGNIGTGMLDLLNRPHDVALLEVSSFQLDLCNTFAPDLAIWTNLQPNHLDRHGSMENYFLAKYNLIARQKAHQKALVPLELKDQILAHNPAGTLYFFTKEQPSASTLTSIENLFFIDNETITLYQNGTTKALINLADLPHLSFSQNWLIICAALHLLDIPLATVATTDFCLDELEHRLEKVATHTDVEFYNDSKSTAPQATLAAVDNFRNKPIHLFLGGISKGIDRGPFIVALKNKVSFVYCFGKEADALKKMCDTSGIACASFATLEGAFDACIQQVAPGSVVLLSPAGASFDLFENYKKRGARFKELVSTLKSTPYR
jgi:UDP-N-acetylmuramoylalanine--D-glutamate ligase